ncbi:cation/H(+) antiporter 15-like [Silene latifolia]|uniref:cation/H(+) antiporter 15-like n=1 Tax=Silene latifolia TaxID=37657 RepID=UPI003D770879
MNQTVLVNPICYAKVVDYEKQWGDIPSLDAPVPKLVFQLALSMVINHGFSFVFQLLRQPRILSSILTALVLSPSTLRKMNENLEKFVFPKDSLLILETMSNLGLIYAMFIQGLHADMTPISHKRYKTTCLGIVAFLSSFLIGCVLYQQFRSLNEAENKTINGEVVTFYWGIITAATSFPTFTPILANLRIFCTNIGQEALALALIHDVFTSVFVQFTLGISTSSPENDSTFNRPSTWLAITSSLLYMVFCGIVIKPIITKISNYVSKGGQTYINDVVLLIIIFFVLTCGFLGNYIGSHFIFAAFVLGTSVPCGVISETLIQKMEECILGVLMPLYFANMGTKIDIDILIKCFKSSLLIVTAVISKALCTFLCSFICNFSVIDGFALGVLLSTKGLIPLVILNIGRDRGHLTQDTYVSLLLIIMLSTAVVAPITSVCYAWTRKSKNLHGQRTLQGANPNEELRIICCIHARQHVYNIINLLEISNITSRPRMSIFALHLIELLGHAPPMLIEHEPHNSYFDVDSTPFFRRATYHSFQIIEAFHEYEENKGTFGLAQLFTMISPIDLIHENICNFAESKHASLIILSSHMQQGIDCNLEDADVEFKVVNQRIMSIAPCSVALFIDRGLRIPCLSSTSIHNNLRNNSEIHTQITMIYISGADDREALTYASRMAKHPFITLTIIRFLIREITMEFRPPDNCGSYSIEQGNDLLEIWKQIEGEKKIDDEFLKDFHEKNADNKSIHYIEKLANTGNEAISILREMHQDCSLYIIGRSQSQIYPLIAGLEVWSEYKELGPLGDILVTSDFSTNSSVLVIQQYNKESSHDKLRFDFGDKKVLFGF